MIAKTNSNVKPGMPGTISENSGLIMAMSSALYLSTGNKKLVSNSDTRFLIWNLPAKITCPYATPECLKNCYAIKSENAYPDCLPCRERNLKLSRNPLFYASMIYKIDSIINSPRERAYSKAKKIIVRVHESGDFYNKAYADAWRRIAQFFVESPGKNGEKLVFMAYTKSISFFVNEDIPENMVVRFSLWDDTTPAQYEIAKSLGVPVYTAVESFENYSGIKCRCKDCATCGLCWNKKARFIACEIH